MRVHPLTRMVHQEATGHWVIEARIEFTDPDRVTTKAIGDLTIQLRDAQRGTDASGEIQTWNQDLRDLEVNRRQYDDVTRTYVFRLEVDSDRFPGQPKLWAFYLGEDGQELEASMEIKRSDL